MADHTEFIGGSRMTPLLKAQVSEGRPAPIWSSH